jgi:hypothetical protein
MIVVADTSPINYLLLIKEIDILPKMYGKVVIPRAVQEEFLRQVAPEIIGPGSAMRPLGSKYVLPSIHQTLLWRSWTRANATRSCLRQNSTLTN